ncbi:MAG: septum formation initiator family protein [Clostridia bacterium]|nr:septum formation initiator family protein [Clostridia bacterium]
MAKKKAKKSRRKHSFLLTVCLISLVIVFVISLVSIKKEIDKRTAEKEQMEQMCSEEDAANEELQSIVDSGNKDEYVEKVAREKYGYIKPGDIVYQDVADGE